MGELQTDRLWFRPFQESDLDDRAALLCDPEVMSFVGHDVRGRTEAKQSLDPMIDHRRHGFGPWVLVQRRDQASASRCGVGYFHDLDDAELLYTLARPYWGQGLATEAAKAVVEYALRTRKLPRIVAYARREDIASQRVMPMSA